MMGKVSDVQVMVRHVGERTLNLCREILARQVPMDAIIEVSGYPFASTLRASFEAGLSAGKKWTLCIDADVVPTPDCVAVMVRVAESCDRPVFECQALVHDKLFGVRRPAGNHIYRTDLLSKALGLIDDAGEVLRPESRIILGMRRAGHPWWQDGGVIGLHDYGQYYRDVARKVFVQADKFSAFRAELRELFAERRDEDPDFRVAMAALDQGVSVEGVDARRLEEPSVRLVEQTGLAEKEPLRQNEAEELSRLASGLAEASALNLTPLERRLVPCLGYP